MALSILDGTQTATTLSTILSSGQHITAHTVVSLGTQAITDMRGAVSGSVVSISNFPATQPVSIASVTIGNTVTIAGTVTVSSLPAISGTVTANVFGKESFENTFVPIQIGANGESFGNGNRIGVALINDAGTEHGTTGTPLNISGTVTANAGANFSDEIAEGILSFQDNEGGFDIGSLPAISGTVTIGSALPTGTNRIGVVTIGAGTVTLGAGTSQIGSVTASISGTVPVSISSVTVGNSVTIGSLPAISGTVTANIGNAVVIQVVGAVQDGDGTTFGIDRDFPVSGSVQIQAGSNQIGSVTANTFAVQGTAVTTSNFTSTTASTVLANYNATREVLTIFNEGAGNLHICAGATCTTIAYQVRLSAGDYYEVPNHQTTITHSAVFATAGTARVTEVS